jgi:hypothetical protein
MSHLPKNLSPDIVRLINEGYEVEIRGSYLLIGHVPYVDSAKTIQFGTLVSALSFSGETIVKPENHVAQFAGSHPCHKDGSIMKQIQHGSGRNQLAEGVVIDHSFSHKPAAGYPDYYAKVTRYVEVISAPAQSIDPLVTAQTYRPIKSEPTDSVFNYVDTNSVRAEIEAISNKMKGQKVAIVGLGGTGSYVLDLASKTSAAEIHLFDADKFAQHNAFRSPGAPSLEELLNPPFKVEYLAAIYSKMRREIHPHTVKLNAANVNQLSGMTFVFICIDDGPTKKEIVGFLVAQKIPFVDVGMGVHVGDDNLVGILRTTTCTPGDHDHLEEVVSFAKAEDDEYDSNIQIAELNMMNAASAVIKWKKLCGFYQDLGGEHNSTYSINVNQLLSDKPNP